jgi:hypothetical protein
LHGEDLRHSVNEGENLPCEILPRLRGGSGGERPRLPLGSGMVLQTPRARRVRERGNTRRLAEVAGLRGDSHERKHASLAASPPRVRTSAAGSRLGILEPPLKSRK